VQRDATDPDKEPKFLYALKDGGLQPYLSGAMSLSDREARGTKQHSGYMNTNTDEGLENAQLQASITVDKAPEIRALFASAPRRDLTKETATNLVPLLNESGEVVNWRYMMAEDTKDQVLERDNRFDRVIGALAASIFDKASVPEQNQKVVDATKQEYDEGYTKSPDSYIKIGPNSTDPAMRQIWAMLPDDTRNYVRKVWGRDGMTVRKDSVDVLFGFRKFSLADMFRRDGSENNRIQNFLVNMFEGFLAGYARRQGMNQEDAERFSKRAAVLVTRGERAWQEVEKEIKDIMVIKSFTVMWGNIRSNLSLLLMAGVPFRDLARHHLVALKGAMAYQNDRAELAQLKVQKTAGVVTGTDINNRIARLEDAIARNPVRELIDAGLMPTIVEDVENDNDPYSYKSQLTRKVEGITSKLHPAVLGAAKQIYMTHDTKTYQTLNRITQLSDFVARYALYQHLTSKKDDPMTHDEAIQRASDSFVNYDIPMPRSLQYMNDMGLTRFTKYFLRIQKVLRNLIRENSGRVLMDVAIGEYFGLGATVMDSSAIAHIGNNPLSWGALSFPGTLDELATVRAMKLLR
jgi:hypothetical protein